MPPRVPTWLHDSTLETVVWKYVRVENRKERLRAQPLVLAGSPLHRRADLSLTFATGRLSNVRNRELRGLVEEQGHSRFWFLPLMQFRYDFHDFLWFRVRTIVLELTNRVYINEAFVQSYIYRLLDSFFLGGKSIDIEISLMIIFEIPKKGKKGRMKVEKVEINFVKAEKLKC